MLDLTNIQATLTERKYMRSARAFRCYLELPPNPVLAAALTALIERQVNVTIKTSDLTAELKPAQVVDVTSRAKKFGLVVETVYEKQNEEVGPSLTAMTGESVSVAITPVSAEPSVKTTADLPTFAGDIHPDSIRGLHTGFFQNKLFYQYLQQKTGEEIDTPATCKAVYKAMMGVDSCKELTQQNYNACLQDFNAWIGKRGQGV